MCSSSGTRAQVNGAVPTSVNGAVPEVPRVPTMRLVEEAAGISGCRESAGECPMGSEDEAYLDWWVVFLEHDWIMIAMVMFNSYVSHHQRVR